VNEAPVSLLIVDDNRMDALLVEQMLKSVERQVPTAARSVESAEQALEELARQPCDVVLLDYQLPGASGLDLLQRLQQLPAGQRPAVVMLTASGSEAIAVAAMKQGAKDYLRKDLLDPMTLVRAVMTALAQKRLEAQVAAAEAQRAEDLGMARELQRALLPQSFPCFPPGVDPQRSALAFCRRYRPTSDLSGDFFDVLPLSDSEAGLLICDVMGHGVRAALVMAMLRAFVQELRCSLRDPAALLSGLNTALRGALRQSSRPLFATALYLVLDARQGQARYARAGHPLPLRLEAATGRVAPLPPAPAAGGPALGLFADAAFPAAAAALDPGDRLVLFTDGLIEAADAGGRLFGEEGLREALERHLASPCERLLDAVLEEVRRFTAGGEFVDDVCLLGAELRRRLP